MINYKITDEAVRLVARPPLGKRITRRVDRFITQTQEWLEGPDGLIETVVAYVTLSAAAGVVLAAIML